MTDSLNLSQVLTEQQQQIQEGATVQINPLSQEILTTIKLHHQQMQQLIELNQLKTELEGQLQLQKIAQQTTPQSEKLLTLGISQRAQAETEAEAKVQQQQPLLQQLSQLNQEVSFLKTKELELQEQIKKQAEAEALKAVVTQQQVQLVEATVQDISDFLAATTANDISTSFLGEATEEVVVAAAAAAAEAEALAEVQAEALAEVQAEALATNTTDQKLLQTLKEKFTQATQAAQAAQAAQFRLGSAKENQEQITALLEQLDLEKKLYNKQQIQNRIINLIIQSKLAKFPNDSSERLLAVSKLIKTIIPAINNSTAAGILNNSNDSSNLLIKRELVGALLSSCPKDQVGNNPSQLEILLNSLYDIVNNSLNLQNEILPLLQETREIQFSFTVLYNGIQTAAQQLQNKINQLQPQGFDLSQRPVLDPPSQISSQENNEIFVDDNDISIESSLLLEELEEFRHQSPQAQQISTVYREVSAQPEPQPTLADQIGGLFRDNTNSHQKTDSSLYSLNNTSDNTMELLSEIVRELEAELKENINKSGNSISSTLLPSQQQKAKLLSYYKFLLDKAKQPQEQSQKVFLFEILSMPDGIQPINNVSAEREAGSANPIQQNINLQDRIEDIFKSFVSKKLTNLNNNLPHLLMLNSDSFEKDLEEAVKDKIYQAKLVNENYQMNFGGRENNIAANTSVLNSSMPAVSLASLDSQSQSSLLGNNTDSKETVIHSPQKIETEKEYIAHRIISDENFNKIFSSDAPNMFTSTPADISNKKPSFNSPLNNDSRDNVIKEIFNNSLVEGQTAISEGTFAKLTNQYAQTLLNEEQKRLAVPGRQPTREVAELAEQTIKHFVKNVVYLKSATENEVMKQNPSPKIKSGLHFKNFSSKFVDNRGTAVSLTDAINNPSYNEGSIFKQIELSGNESFGEGISLYYKFSPSIPEELVINNLRHNFHKFTLESLLSDNINLKSDALVLNNNISKQYPEFSIKVEEITLTLEELKNTPIIKKLEEDILRFPDRQAEIKKNFIQHFNRNNFGGKTSFLQVLIEEANQQRQRQQNESLMRQAGEIGQIRQIGQREQIVLKPNYSFINSDMVDRRHTQRAAEERIDTCIGEVQPFLQLANQLVGDSEEIVRTIVPSAEEGVHRAAYGIKEMPRQMDSSTVSIEGIENQDKPAVAKLLLQTKFATNTSVGRD